MKKKNMVKYALIVSGALTLVICTVMNFYLLPLIESTTEGIKAFDMNSFGYSFEQAKRFVSLLDERGLSFYLHVQLPLDFVYPIAYTTFFSLALLKLTKNKKYLLAFPLLLMASDYTENVFSIIMLKTDFVSSVARTASTVTVIKTALMYITIILVLVFFVQWIINQTQKRIRAKNNF